MHWPHLLHFIGHFNDVQLPGCSPAAIRAIAAGCGVWVFFGKKPAGLCVGGRVVGAAAAGQAPCRRALHCCWACNRRLETGRQLALRLRTRQLATARGRA